jgi:3-hydroxyacyl-[acyl-carrier-protein] dehydratase
MPLNDFFSYTINSNESGHIKALLSIDQNHDIFKGHFPGNPVTPGVTQLEMVRQVLSKCTNKDLMLTEAKDLKFLSPLLPPQTHDIELTIDYKEEQGTISTRCVLSRNDQVFTKIRGTFSEK